LSNTQHRHKMDAEFLFIANEKNHTR